MNPDDGGDCGATVSSSRVIWEDEPMPTSRYVIAVLALVIFISASRQCDRYPDGLIDRHRVDVHDRASADLGLASRAATSALRMARGASPLQETGHGARFNRSVAGAGPSIGTGRRPIACADQVGCVRHCTFSCRRLHDALISRPQVDISSPCGGEFIGEESRRSPAGRRAGCCSASDGWLDVRLRTKCARLSARRPGSGAGNVRSPARKSAIPRQHPPRSRQPVSLAGSQAPSRSSACRPGLSTHRRRSATACR